MSKQISFSSNNEHESGVTSAWLVSFIKWAETINLFEYFKDINVSMKEVDYKIFQKFITLCLSIVVGCKSTVEINEKLVPDVIAANMLDMERFPEQSTINELLRRISEQNIDELKEIHHRLFMENSRILSTTETVVVDIDQSGLIANGNSFKFADKGYFAKKRNQKGYQLSAAFCGGDINETLGVYMDPGSTHCSSRFKDIFNDILSKLKDINDQNLLILRMDSGYGTQEIIEYMKDKTLFLVKGYSTVTAANLAKGIPSDDWIEVDKFVDVYELPTSDGLRHILVRIMQKNGRFVYTQLITNLPTNEYDPIKLFHFYNQRQTIEAFFKMSKNIYGMKNLRTRDFTGSLAFIWMVFITHNAIVWMQNTVFHETDLENKPVGFLVKKLGAISATIRKVGEITELILPSIHALARKFIEIMKPKYQQLTLFD